MARGGKPNYGRKSSRFLQWDASNHAGPPFVQLPPYKGLPEAGAWEAGPLIEGGPRPAKPLGEAGLNLPLHPYRPALPKGSGVVVLSRRSRPVSLGA